MLKREKHDAVSITQIQNACELPLSLYPGHDPPFLLLHRLTPSSLSLVWTTPMWPAWDDWLEWFLSKRSAILSDESCFIYVICSTSPLSSPLFLALLPVFLFFSGWPHLQLRKAIEGSVTVTGVKVRPPLASFRDSGNTTNVSEVTELHKLCIRHRGLSLPREPNPPNVEDQPDLQYKEIPVNFSDETNVQFEASPGDITNPSSELPLQESPSFTEDQSEFTFDCSPSHTEESELACDFDPSNQTPEPDEMEQEEAPPSLNNSQSEPGGGGSTGHTEDQSEWSDPHCRLMNVDVSYICWGHTHLQVQPRYSWYDSERVLERYMRDKAGFVLCF